MSGLAAEAAALLAAERLTVRHRGAEFDSLRDVSLACGPGEIVALCGPNGSGKSTLLATLAGELRPRAGRVWIDGRPLRERSRRQLARIRAVLPQAPTATEGVSVEALVATGRYAWGAGDPDGERVVRRVLRRLDLLELRRRGLETLSGGERRRAFLAMVLAQEAPLVFLDEPTAALDLRYQRELEELLLELNREEGLTLLVSLHDLEQAARLAHRVVLLHRGRVYASGPPTRVFDAEALRDVFGVDAEVEKRDGRLYVAVHGPADPLRSL